MGPQPSKMKPGFWSAASASRGACTLASRTETISGVLLTQPAHTASATQVGCLIEPLRGRGANTRQSICQARPARLTDRKTAVILSLDVTALRAPPLLVGLVGPGGRGAGRALDADRTTLSRRAGRG